MSSILDSIRAEYHRYQLLAERAIQQVPDAVLTTPLTNHGNSIATIVWHVAGNLQSRFTAFLSEDGEKSWRQREEEFAARDVPRDALLAQWQKGWHTLYDAIEPLVEADLHRTVTIRQQPLTVHDALHRSLAHVSYHVGQIVYVAHAHRGAEWQYLSIPPGGTSAYNAAPTLERPADHARHLDGAVDNARP